MQDEIRGEGHLSAWMFFLLVFLVGGVAAAAPARPSSGLWKPSQASKQRSLRHQMVAPRPRRSAATRRRVARAATSRRGRLRRLDLRPRLRRLQAKRRRKVAQNSASGADSAAAQDPQKQDLPSKTLGQVYQMAKRHNVDMKLLKQRLRLAELARARAWVGLHPTVGVSGSYTRNQQEVAFNGAVITPLNQLSLGLQVNWTFLNLSLIPGVQAASLSQTQTKMVTAQTRRELFFSVARGYYNVLLSQGAVEIADQSHRFTRANLQHVMVRQKAGVATPIQLSQAKLDEARARQSLQNATNSLRNARLALALLLGQKTFPYRAVKPTAPAVPPGALTDWRKDARERREEMKAKRYGVKIQEAKIRQAWTKLLPTAGANAGMQLTNATGFAGQNVQWSLGLSLQWQLYNGNHALGIQEGHVGLRQARLELKKQEQAVDNEIRTAWNNLRNARRATKLAKQSADLARQTLTLQQQRYRSGTATPLAVSDALSKAYSAQISHLREDLNQALAVLGLQRAVGAFPSHVKSLLAAGTSSRKLARK